MTRIFPLCLALMIVGLLAACDTTDSTSNGAVKSILEGDASNIFIAHPNNVGGADAIQSANIGGQNTARFLLRYEDKGPLLDWERHGQPGFAQRIQYYERWNDGAMKLGSEHWYLISMYVEPFQSGVQSVDPFDLNPLFTVPAGRTHRGQPVFSGTFQRGQFAVRDTFGGRGYECAEYTDISGNPNLACNRTETKAILGSQGSFSGRWIEIIFHARWKNDETGLFRYWVDGKSRLVFKGNTARGANRFQFKFGPYRHHMKGAQSPVAINYSRVARAQTCAGLGIPNCAELEANGQAIGRRNVQRVNSGYVDELTRLRRDPTDG